jgi:hypothetical protein
MLLLVTKYTYRVYLCLIAIYGSNNCLDTTVRLLSRPSNIRHMMCTYGIDFMHISMHARTKGHICICIYSMSHKLKSSVQDFIPQNCRIRRLGWHTYIVHVLRFFLKCTVPGTRLSIYASRWAWPPLIWTILFSGVIRKPVTIIKNCCIIDLAALSIHQSSSSMVFTLRAQTIAQT